MVVCIGPDDRIVGLVERARAHSEGLRHLTTIIVAYVEGGADDGKWLVHDRAPKQWAQGRSCSSPERNLFGGHCDRMPDGFIGLRYDDERVKNELLFQTALKEAKEEMYLRADPGAAGVPLTPLEVWSGYGNRAPVTVRGRAYADMAVPEFVGFARYCGKNNDEVSAVYKASVPHALVAEGTLLGADNYLDDAGNEHHVLCEVHPFSKAELAAMPEAQKCDALTRLWASAENMAVLNLLPD